MDSEQEDLELKPEPEIIKNVPRKRYVEPAIFLIFLAWNFSSAVFTNEIVYQTCSVKFGYNISDCKQLGTSNQSKHIQDLETEVQPYAASVKMVKSMVESLFPAIVNLFLGNWSDQYGRKPIIINSVTGTFLSYLILSITTYVATLIPVNPWYFMLSSLPILISGGNCGLITGTLAYITDVTNESDRAIRMGLLEAYIYIGLLIGSVSSSYILYLTNTITMFAISGICVFISLIYVIFLLDESLTTTNNELEGTSKLREIFRFSLLTDMFKACFRRRPNYDRAIIWLTMMVLGINIFVLEGAYGVFYLFVREKFQWTIRDYTIYDATSICTQIAGNIFAMFILIKVVKLPEIALVIIAFISYFVDSTIGAIAYYSWHLYLAVGLSLLKPVASPMCRAILAKIVSGNDVGKVFSLTTSIETFLPIISAMLYTFVYNETLNFYPGAFNIISLISYLVCIVIMITVFVFLRRRSEEVLYHSA